LKGQSGFRCEGIPLSLLRLPCPFYGHFLRSVQSRTL
jgi:hypothetical protein